MGDSDLTGIPIPPPPPPTAGYQAHCDYSNSLLTHPSHTQRVRWPCCKCGQVFFEHCGLDILAKHGRVADK